MKALSTLAAIWVGEHGWNLSATGPKDTVACEIISDNWRREPAWRDPARLVDWALSIARSNETPPPAIGRTLKFAKRADADKVTRFALLISPQACARFDLGATPAPKTLIDQHPWHDALTAAGWKIRSRTIGPWITIERPGAELGVLLVGWLDRSKPRELAGHGVVLGSNGHPDGWSSCFTHGEYRRRTGWPLSAGAGMAAVKGLWRYPREAKVRWSADDDHWAAIPALASRDQRPWHVHWTQTGYDAWRTIQATGEVALWDANADYLTAWTSARFARGLLQHTGPGGQRHANGQPWAGYYLIGDIDWAPEVQYAIDMLPPIWGSRTPRPDGSVWVTHVIVQLLDSMRWAEDYEPPTYRILDSYACEDSGQIARGWGDKLKAALIEAREEADRTKDAELIALAEALKQSYARGYPLMENAGFYKRPDHVDTLIDQRWDSAYRRMFKAAWDGERYPLDVSADEITYLWRDGDERNGPLGEPDPRAFGRYKVKRRGTVAEWRQSHADGRRGRWWMPAPELPAPGAPEPAQPATQPTGDAGDGWDWLTTARG